MQLLALLFVWLQFECLTASNINYVRPADSLSSTCPGQPCLTLCQYAQRNNFTSGTILLFMPGNHSLEITLNLTEISNITLRKKDGNSTANIICTNAGTIDCENVTNLNIEGLQFMILNTSSALNLIGCTEIFIAKSNFTGFSKRTGRAMWLQNTQGTIWKCAFRRTSVRKNGGAILMDGTNLTVHGSLFFENEAWGTGGGAIYAYLSALHLEENQFTHNFSWAILGFVVGGFLEAL